MDPLVIFRFDERRCFQETDQCLRYSLLPSEDRSVAEVMQVTSPSEHRHHSLTTHTRAHIAGASGVGSNLSFQSITKVLP